jgi:hypothetical protein
MNVVSINILLGLCLLGCVAADSTNKTNAPSAKPGMSNNCPEPAALENPKEWQLASGDYSAEQSGDMIIVRAHGSNPTPNFKMRFVLEKGNRLVLYRQRPAGMQLQVMKGFAVCTKFKPAETLESITVRDAQGDHAIKIEKANSNP